MQVRIVLYQTTKEYAFVGSVDCTEDSTFFFHTLTVIPSSTNNSNQSLCSGYETISI